MSANKMEDINTAFKEAVQYYQIGQLQQAEMLCHQTLQQQPKHADTLHLLGGIAHRHGDNHRATELIKRAIAIAPNSPLYYFNLGIAHKALNQLNDARTAYEQALALKPDYAEAWNDLGLILYLQGHPHLASDKYQKAITYKPDYAQAWNNMGNIIRDQGKLQKAISYYETALRFKPDYADAHNNLGNMLGDTGRKEEALKHFQRALTLQPDLVEAHSNLLYMLSYNVLCTPQQMLKESRQWDRSHGGKDKALTFSHTLRNTGPTSGNPGKHLRIGYVSPDLHRHAVSYFFESILANHDHQKVEVFCYAEVKHSDAVTQRLQSLTQHWRSTVGLSDEAVAHLIHEDQIDILIDLAGHTAHSRLSVFAYKPAPVQAAYLGYCATTGLETMDYWITDHVLHPENTVELATETIYRLPRCWLCYRPDETTPPVSQHQPGNSVTFGSFNHLSKITPEVIALWSKILRAVPNSRLTLKTRALADPEISAQLITRFASHDIPSGHLNLLPATATYLEAYHDIDIALDPFPRTGGATTADALWMGVPIITLVGQRYIERQGASMLSAIRLNELIATSKQEYLDKAVALANNPEQRQHLHHTLRQRMAQSPLCDGKGLAQTLEDAYQFMWRQSLQPVTS